MPRPALPRERADNAGFSIVLVLGGFLALGLLAFALSHDDVASKRTVETQTAQPHARL